MISSEQRKLTGVPSFILDFLRITAALVVFATHVYDQWNPTGKFHDIRLPGNLAHGAVVIFFVLSGYVIAHTTLSNKRGATSYYVARLSRLCSIVIPALLITAFCEFLVHRFDPALWLANQRGYPLVRYGLSAMFSNEIWSLSAAPPINRPLWSLSFEFWYYILFGLLFYRLKGAVGWIIAILGCCIAGPKILLMSPIWAVGFFAYRLRRPAMREWMSWSLAGVAAAFGIGVFMVSPPLPFALGSRPFYFANQFVTDIGLGFTIALVFYFLPDGRPTGRTDDGFYSRFRKFADLTFPIYVLHLPILILWRSIFGTQFGDLQQGLAAFCSVLLVCAFLGLMLERYKGIWYSFFQFCAGTTSAARTRFGRRFHPTSLAISHDDAR